MRRAIEAFVLGLVLATSANAQSAPNPVVEHFRAYRAAVAAGDMARAENEAAAALAASEARDGDAGRTAVLALNLASLRLELGKRAEARSPAQRAYALAAARADSGIDPHMARLVLARASLGDDVASRDALHAALAESAAREDLAGDVYLAAVELGRLELSGRRFPQAASAWAVARDTSHAADGDTQLARANALIARAAALIYQSMSSGVREVQPSEYEAKQLLIEARSIANERRTAYRQGGEPDEADRTYGAALAWEATLEALLGRLLRPWGRFSLAAVRGEPAQICPYEVNIGRRPYFPAREGTAGNVGAVVVQLQTNDAGQVIRRDVLGAAPGNDGFTNVVSDVMDTWTVTWAANAPAGCTRAERVRMPFTFIQ